MKAAAIEELKSSIPVESPATRACGTVSERVSLVKIDPEPQYYTAPSTPEKKAESMQTAPEKFVAKLTELRQKRSDRSPDLQYVTAPSSPVKLECTTSKQRRSSKSPRQRGSKSHYVTAPSSPIMAKSKVSSLSPQALRLSAKLKLKRTSSPQEITLPNDDRSRREFLLNAYDKRRQNYIAFLAATFELQNAIGNKKGLQKLVCEQRQFEKKWPPQQGEAKQSEKDAKELIAATAIEKRELKMLDDVFHGQAFLEILWNIFDAKMSE